MAEQKHEDGSPSRHPGLKEVDPSLITPSTESISDKIVVETTRALESVSSNSQSLFTASSSSFTKYRDPLFTIGKGPIPRHSDRMLDAPILNAIHQIDSAFLKNTGPTHTVVSEVDLAYKFIQNSQNADKSPDTPSANGVGSPTHSTASDSAGVTDDSDPAEVLNVSGDFSNLTLTDSLVNKAFVQDSSSTHTNGSSPLVLDPINKTTPPLPQRSPRDRDQRHRIKAKRLIQPTLKDLFAKDQSIRSSTPTSRPPNITLIGENFDKDSHFNLTPIPRATFINPWSSGNEENSSRENSSHPIDDMFIPNAQVLAPKRDHPTSSSNSSDESLFSMSLSLKKKIDEARSNTSSNKPSRKLRLVDQDSDMNKKTDFDPMTKNNLEILKSLERPNTDSVIMVTHDSDITGANSNPNVDAVNIQQKTTYQGNINIIHQINENVLTNLDSSSSDLQLDLGRDVNQQMSVTDQTTLADALEDRQPGDSTSAADKMQKTLMLPFLAETLWKQSKTGFRAGHKSSTYGKHLLDMATGQETPILTPWVLGVAPAPPYIQEDKLLMQKIVKMRKEFCAQLQTMVAKDLLTRSEDQIEAAQEQLDRAKNLALKSGCDDWFLAETNLARMLGKEQAVLVKKLNDRKTWLSTRQPNDLDWSNFHNYVTAAKRPGEKATQSKPAEPQASKSVNPPITASTKKKSVTDLGKQDWKGFTIPLKSGRPGTPAKEGNPSSTKDIPSGQGSKRRSRSCPRHRGQKGKRQKSRGRQDKKRRGQENRSENLPTSRSRSRPPRKSAKRGDTSGKNPQKQRHSQNQDPETNRRWELISMLLDKM